MVKKSIYKNKGKTEVYGPPTYSFSDKRTQRRSNHFLSILTVNVTTPVYNIFSSVLSPVSYTGSSCVPVPEDSRSPSICFRTFDSRTYLIRLEFRLSYKDCIFPYLLTFSHQTSTLVIMKSNRLYFDRG